MQKLKKEVVNYDTYDYDYSTYWDSRNYEHNAEVILINKLLEGTSGDRFIDIGGSYGRLTPTYGAKYKQSYIVDYSLKTLQKSYKSITESWPNTTLVAANVYNLPFKDSVFDGGLMVRVLHHLSDQKQYLNELSRTLNPNANFIQEIPNKIHLKWRLSRYSRGNFSQFNVKPLQQAFFGGQEGAKGEEVTFLNYHPKYIESLFRDFDFEIIEKRGCSFLRSTPLANKIPMDSTLSIEKFLQGALNNTELTPSIFYKLTLKKHPSSTTKHQHNEDIYVCPKCKNVLTNISDEEKRCDKCTKSYKKESGVWDFRAE